MSFFPSTNALPQLYLKKFVLLLPLMCLFQKETGFCFQDCQTRSFHKNTKIHSIIAHHRTHACSLKIEVFGVGICLFDSSVLNFETSGTVKCLSDNGEPELSHAK